MRIQDVQSDIILSKKLAEYAETVLAQHQEIEQLKSINASQAELLKAAQEQNKALESEVEKLRATAVRPPLIPD